MNENTHSKTATIRQDAPQGRPSMLSRIAILALGLSLSANVLSLCAEDLTLTTGTVYKNVTITKVDPDGLRIIHSDGGGKVLFSQLPEAIQKKYNYDPAAAQKYTDEQEAKKKEALNRILQQAVAKQADENRTPAVATPERKVTVKTPADTIYPMIRGKLDYLDGTRLSRFDESKLSGVRYYAVYYSAYWCQPCRAFTPELVAFYNEFKPKHPEFELLFISLDLDEKGQLEYMKTASMPWPAVRFSELEPTSPGHRKASGIQQYAGSGIPDLVLLDASSGTVMSASHDGENYLGPQKVLQDIRTMVK